MEMASQIAQRLAARIFAIQDKLEDAVLVKVGRGTRDRTGQWRHGTSTTTSVRLASAPLTGRERETLPEGLRAQDVRKFWLRERVQVVDIADGDIIRYNGLSYRAIMVQDWGAFYEVTGVQTSE